MHLIFELQLDASLLLFFEIVGQHDRESGCHPKEETVEGIERQLEGKPNNVGDRKTHT